MSFWNNKALRPPANTTYKATDKSLDIKSLTAVLNEGIDIFSKERTLQLEGALLTRILYRLNLRYRNDKSYKSASKTSKALKKFLNVNFNSIITFLLKHLPPDYIHETYLPNRNMFDHLLIKAQGLAKLLCTIAEYAKETAIYLENKLHIGHVWRDVFMLLSIISRIFVITKYLAKYICSFYNRLFNFRQAFETPQKQWAPKDYNFPNPLENFLQAEILQEEIIEKPEYDIKWPKFIIDYDSDVEFMSEYFEIADENNDLEIINEYIQILDDHSDIEEIQPRIKAISRSSKNAFNKRIPNLFNLSLENDEDIGEVVHCDSVAIVEDELNDLPNSISVADVRNALDDSVTVVEDALDDSVSVVEDVRNVLADSDAVQDDSVAVNDVRNVFHDSIAVNDVRNVFDDSVVVNDVRNVFDDSVVVNDVRNVFDDSIAVNDVRNVFDDSVVVNDVRNVFDDSVVVNDVRNIVDDSVAVNAVRNVFDDSVADVLDDSVSVVHDVINVLDDSIAVVDVLDPSVSAVEDARNVLADSKAVQDARNVLDDSVAVVEDDLEDSVAVVEDDLEDSVAVVEDDLEDSVAVVEDVRNDLDNSVEFIEGLECNIDSRVETVKDKKSLVVDKNQIKVVMDEVMEITDEEIGEKTLCDVVVGEFMEDNTIQKPKVKKRKRKKKKNGVDLLVGEEKNSIRDMDSSDVVIVDIADEDDEKKTILNVVEGGFKKGNICNERAKKRKRKSNVDVLVEENTIRNLESSDIVMKNKVDIAEEENERKTFLNVVEGGFKKGDICNERAKKRKKKNNVDVLVEDENTIRRNMDSSEIVMKNKLDIAEEENERKTFLNVIEGGFKKGDIYNERVKKRKKKKKNNVLVEEDENAIRRNMDNSEIVLKNKADFAEEENERKTWLNVIEGGFKGNIRNERAKKRNRKKKNNDVLVEDESTIRRNLDSSEIVMKNIVDIAEEANESKTFLNVVEGEDNVDKRVKKRKKKKNNVNVLNVGDSKKYKQDINNKGIVTEIMDAEKIFSNVVEGDYKKVQECGYKSKVQESGKTKKRKKKKRSKGGILVKENKEDLDNSHVIINGGEEKFFFENVKSKKKNNDVFASSNIKSFKDLALFLKFENQQRKANPQRCKIKCLNKSNWNTLCNSFLQFAEASKKDKRNKHKYLQKAKQLFQPK